MALRRAGGVFLGVLAGAGAAFALVLFAGSPSGPPPLSGKLVDEAAGSIESVAFHFVPEAEPVVGPAYRAFLPSLDPGTRLVALVAPDPAGGDPAEKLRRFLRSLPGGDRLAARTRIAVAGAAISTWSKDRALVTAETPARLLVPADPAGPGDRWRADWDAPGDLARAFPDALRTQLLPLDFDAGDLAVSGGRLIVDANLAGKNGGRGLGDPEKLVPFLERLFGMRVVMLGRIPGDVPRHHLSMYLTPLTDGLVLLGDPREGRRLVGERYAPGEKSPETGRPLQADFSEATLARYDRARAALEAAGFQVVRIPTVPFDDKTYFAYTNGVFETRAGRRIAWVPVFDVPALDQAGLQVYRDLGWEVRPVPGRAAFAYHGTIGCLVNVLARGRR